MEESSTTSLPARDFQDDISDGEGYFEDEDDMLETDSEEDEDDDTDLETGFRAAATVLKQNHYSFSKPDALYEFLYRFRDVTGLVTEDSGTLLHVAIELAKTDKDVRSSNMMPLIQSIVKEHPQLLTARNSEGLTPLYMAICTRKPLLIEAMLSDCAKYAEWQSAVQDSIEIPNVQQNNRSCLHMAFRLDIRERAVIKLMTIARDKAFAMQDDSGMTPLHYAVAGSRPSLHTMRLFIQRDKDILKTRGIASISRPVETFLDIIDRKGLSVYRHHLTASSLAIKKEDIRITYQKRRAEPAPVPAHKTSEIKSERPSKSNESQMKLDKGHRETKSIDTTPVPETREERAARKRKQAAGEWKEILQELKLHYIRTRTPVMVESFLYGENIDDVQFCLNYRGLPSTITDTAFESAFGRMKFDDTFQFFSCPNVKVELTGRRRLLHDTQKGGKGRRDVQFFFDWLYTKGVRYIIRVDVEESSEFPHSDQAILESLERIQVEHLNWQKVDMDPQVICRLGAKATWRQDDSGQSISSGSEIKELTLLWSGNNAVLRAWSEPEGLLLLPRLMKINIIVPPAEEMTESQEWLSNCIQDFRQRIVKLSLGVAIPKEGESGILPKEEHAPDSESTKRDIEVFFIQRKGEGRGWEELNTLGQGRAIAESRAGHRWLDSVYGFADVIKPMWHQLYNNTDIADDVVVALIDDGIDAYGSSASENIIGGKSFAFDHARDIVSPYYVSQFGHGTVMAKAVVRVCPMAKLYPLRVNILGSETGKSDVDLKSAALAVQAAINRKVNIILISWSIETANANSSVRDKDLFYKMLQKAYDHEILIFCPSSDSGELQTSSRLRPDLFFRVGTARDDGGVLSRPALTSDTDFIFPGSEVILQHEIDTSRHSNESPDTITTYSGSSVSAAIGAGLGALLICSFKFILRKFELTRTRQSLVWDYRVQGETLQSRHVMIQAFQNLGSMTDSRFLKAWETLDPIIEEMKDASLEDPGLDRLARFFMQLEF